jgi:hypothetical protein
LCAHTPFRPGLSRSLGSTPRTDLAGHGTIRLLREPGSMFTAVTSVARWPHDVSE